MKKNQKITKIFWKSIFILFFGFCTYASTELQDYEKSCFWKVQTKNNCIYLLGSIHALKEENYPLKRSIEEAFNEAGIIVFEVNLDSAVTPKAVQMIFNKAIYSGEKTLKSELSEETYKLAEKISLELGLNIAQMNKFKPWFFTVTLLGMKIKKMGFDPKYGVDRYFFDKAKLMGKEIIGLESIEYQVNLFADIVEDDQEELVLQTLKEMDIFEEELQNIITAWMNGDISELNKQILQSFREYPKIYKKLILQRNMNWIHYLDALLHQEKNVFIVVGAGHLLGEEGLIQLLIDKGYLVKQL